MVRRLVLLFLCLFLVDVASAQCPGGCEKCRAPVGCQGQCAGPCGGVSQCSQDCQHGCICSGPQKGFSQQFHPGFFVSSTLDGDYVSGVIPGSPADLNGIQVGDEILAINAEEERFHCEGATWESCPGVPDCC